MSWSGGTQREDEVGVCETSEYSTSGWCLIVFEDEYSIISMGVEYTEL